MYQPNEDLPSIAHSHNGTSLESPIPSSWINRRSEEPATYFRTDRYFTVGHEWYITKREGGYLGPYLTKKEAELALAKRIAFLFVVDGQVGNTLENDHGRPATEFERLVHQVLARWRQRWSKSREDHPDAQGRAGAGA